MKRRTLLTGATGLAAALSTHSWAQSSAYPNKPIKLIIPYAAGISPDVIGRLISDKLSQALGQPLVVDNRAGAGGMIGAEAAAAMPADNSSKPAAKAAAKPAAKPAAKKPAAKPAAKKK